MRLTHLTLSVPFPRRISRSVAAAQKPAVVSLAQNRRNLSRKSQSLLHSSLALSASFRICSARRERVLRAVTTPQRSGNCSMEPQQQQKHRMPWPSQNLPVSELRGKQVTCRARTLLARTAPSNDLPLEIPPNHLVICKRTSPQPSKLLATPRSIFHDAYPGRVR
jgi:hypothetical protein